MKISIIAAIGKNRELGKDNKLIWHIQEDLQRFRKLTKGHPIIMGRKTWESLPMKPLPSRTNIVITRNPDFSHARRPLAWLANNLEEAIEIAKKEAASAHGFGPLRPPRLGEAGSEASEPKEIFIIGGGQIYKQAIEKGFADKLYLTVIDSSFEADTFFPDYSEFKKVVFEKQGEEGKYRYKFLELER